MHETLSTGEIGAIRVRAPEPFWLRVAQALTLVVAGLVVCLGVLFSVIYVLLSLLAPHLTGDTSLRTVALGFSVLSLSILLGGSLVFQAVSALTRRTSSTLVLPSPVVFLIAFIVVVGLSLLVSLAGHRAWWLIPGPYVLGIALPVGLVVSMAGNRLRQRGTASTWREFILHLSSGAFVVTTTALTGEVLAILGLVIAAAVVLSVLPGGLDALRELTRNLQTPGWIDNPDNLQRLMLSPAILFGVFSTLSIAVPLIEEFFKAIGVVLTIYRRPSREQALWWGLLGGAGFALAEGLLNGTLGLGEMPWAATALMRFGTTLVHCLGGALMGLGWHSLLRQRHFLGWLKRYAQAVLLHGLWNGLTISLAFSPVWAASRGAEGKTLGGLIAITLASLLVVEAIGIGIVLLHLASAAPETGRG